MKRFGEYFAVILVFLASCSEDEKLRLNDEEYFPLTVGFYQVYDVDEVVYSAFSPPMHFSYELKSEIIDSFTDLAGGTTYVIHRSKRSNDNSDWEFSETWSIRNNGQYVIEMQGNTPYAKLVFPLQKNSRWNGNRFNASEEDEYVLESINRGFITDDGNVSFPNSLVVVQGDEQSLLSRDERVEVYSFGKGLVYKESKVYQYNISGGLPGSQIIGGYYWKQVLKEYGQH